MTAIKEHLSQDELRALIDGSIADVEAERCTLHLEDCASCRDTMLTMASGEVPIDQLVAGMIDSVPPDESAYWPAVSNVQDEVARELDSRRSKSADQIVPISGNDSLADTRPGWTHDTPVERPAAKSELDFLEPSDDPAYLGKLHHFQIARVIGRGGMGIVLEAFDTHLQRSVAIKVLNPQYQGNDLARQRFCREGRAAAAIAHEHVVAMHQVAKANQGEVAYLVMQLIDGDTLEDRIQEGQLIPAGEVARIGMQIAAGLAAAHKQGMVHRDIKPANVLIENETERVKLTDFGLARAADDVKLTKTGMVTGTPLYMSPEQTMGESADERSDLFSLGAVLYEMATGVAPFQAPSALGVMKRILEEHPPAPHRITDAVSRPLSDLIMSLLEKKPDDRPESAAVVASALASTAQLMGSVSPMQVPTIAAADAGKISGSYNRVARRYAIAAWVAGAVAAASLVFAFFASREPNIGDSFPSTVLPENPGTVWSVDFANDGTHVLAAIEDGTVRRWNIAEQKLENSFNAHRGIVWMVVHSPDESMIATSGDDGLIKFWEGESFELLREFDAGSSVREISFSPDGKLLATGNRDGEIHIIDVSSGESIRSISQPGTIYGVAFSSDGRRIATGGSDKLVRIWDAETLELRQTLSGHAGPIYNIAFAENEPLLASVGWNKNIMVWNADTGELVHNLVGSEGDIWGVSFCSESSHLVTGEQMGAARIWDLSTGQAVLTLRGHSSAVHNVSLDPERRRIATSSRDGTIRVWDLSELDENPKS